MLTLGQTVAQQIVERVGSSLNLPISLLDTAAQVLASGSARGADGREAGLARAAGEALSRDGRASPSARITLPLLHDNLRIGTIVIHDDSAQAAQLAPVAKALAEMIVHQHLLLEQITRQQWVRDGFIFNLLHGSFHAVPEVVEHEAAALGISLNAPRIIAIITIPSLDDGDEQSPLGYPSHLLDQARTSLNRHSQDAYSWLHPHTIVVLSVIDPQQEEQERRSLAQGIQRFLDQLTPELGETAAAGVGRYYAGWPLLSQSFADARFALELGTRIYGTSRVFFPKDLGLASYVCQDDAVWKSEIARRLLQPLLDKPDLLATLKTYLKTELSPSLTAELLCIHRHTLDYRLSKIAQLTGLDPRQFNAAAQFLAALLCLWMNGVRDKLLGS